MVILNELTVGVYWNLHKQCWSVKGIRTGRVVTHAKELLISEPTYIVQKGGRRRVLKERKKNVHAFVRGRIEAYVKQDFDYTIADYLCDHEVVQVLYNPYKYENFVVKTESGFDKVHSSDYCFLSAEGEAYGLWKTDDIILQKELDL